MTRPLDRALEAELAAWERAGLRRTLPQPQGGAPLHDFVSNDYLGLSRDRRVVDAAREALERSGAGSGAARLLGGGLAGAVQGASGGEGDAARAERLLAEWLDEEAALLFPSGFQANLGVVATLADRGDALFSDELNHASLIDGCRLSRAKSQVFPHGDVAELERQLARARGARRRVVVTESVFSMDGDLAPLAALHEACERHDAWLIVDEAHGHALLGPHGAGAWAAAGLPNARQGSRPTSRLAARIVTGGKALGVAGAFVVGGRPLIELLLNAARPFVFTTAPPPAVAAALAAAIEVAREADAARARVLALAQRLAKELKRGAFAVRTVAPAAAIVPFVVGEAAATSALGRELATAGFAVGAVRPPTVPDGSARLRLVVHATNDEAQVDALAAAVVARARPKATSGVTRDGRSSRATAWFVVGTDTGIGKTVASALLLRAARRLGKAAYWKPVQTGDESDTAAVAALAQATPDELLAPLHHFPKPASPHEAAAAAGEAIDPAVLQAALTAAREERRGARLIVELAGGLLVPYVSGANPFLQAEWLARARPRLIVVARSGLGTLNHTLLTLEALRARKLEPDALLLVGERHAENAATLRELAGVAPLFELPRFEPLSGGALEAWLDQNALAEVLR
ncbi:MAG: dethiobiotin synthase [Planctomycetes bacterium]|nr:dethiobiotin synthase [Planctomycetota bacterium]